MMPRKKYGYADETFMFISQTYKEKSIIGSFITCKSNIILKANTSFWDIHTYVNGTVAS